MPPQVNANRGRGYLALRLFSAPLVKNYSQIYDQHERESVSRAHDMSEAVVFDNSGDVVMVVKAMPDQVTSVRIGLKASEDYLIVTAKKLDDEQREKLHKFHATLCGRVQEERQRD